MTNKTKTIIGVVAVAGIGYYLYMQMKKKQGSNKNFANYVDEDFFNMTSKKSGCKLYAGSVSSPNGTVISQWEGGVRGVIVNNGSTTGQTLVCPEGQTSLTPVAG